MALSRPGAVLLAMPAMAAPRSFWDKDFDPRAQQRTGLETRHALKLPVGKNDSAIAIAQQDAVRDGLQQRWSG